eukprot:10062157-Alexandrium_andersonii.AAC.1
MGLECLLVGSRQPRAGERGGQDSRRVRQAHGVANRRPAAAGIAQALIRQDILELCAGGDIRVHDEPIAVIASLWVTARPTSM